MPKEPKIHFLPRENAMACGWVAGPRSCADVTDIEAEVTCEKCKQAISRGDDLQNAIILLRRLVFAAERENEKSVADIARRAHGWLTRKGYMGSILRATAVDIREESATK